MFFSAFDKAAVRLLFLGICVSAFAGSRFISAVDEMNVDRLFGIPSQPEIDDIFSGEPIDALHAFNTHGVIDYSFRAEMRGIYGRKFGELHRIVNLEETFQTAVGVSFPVDDILEPEWGPIAVALIEFRARGGHTLTFDLFSSSFKDQKNKTLDASHYSIRYSYRAIENRWGFISPEVGYNVFKYTASFNNWFEPDLFGPFQSVNTVPNPTIGFSARLRTSELSALIGGIRANPCPIDWLDTNMTRLDIRWEYITLRFLSFSVGYDLYTIRFQNPDVGESAAITQHGPFLTVDLFL